MAEIDFKWYLLTFAIASLFIVSMFSFGETLISNANESISLVDEERFNVEEINNNLEDVNTKGQSLLDAFRSETPNFATGVLALLSIWGIILKSIDLTYQSFVLFADLLSTTLGIPVIAIGILALIVTSGLIFAGWKLLKLGE